jgi:hypothetical protein
MPGEENQSTRDRATASEEFGLNADLNPLKLSQAGWGNIYNLESGKYIAQKLSSSSGAHNDIMHPQVAHEMWSAVLL